MSPKKLQRTMITTLNILLITTLSGCGSETKNLPSDNTPAVITGELTGTVIEDTQSIASGNLTVTDPDPNEAMFIAQTATQGSYGQFTLTASGEWSYTLNQQLSQVQELSPTDSLSESFSVSTVDGTTSTITINISGTDDVPEISGMTEGILDLNVTDNISGNITITGGDKDEALFIAQTNTTGTHGTFSIDANGQWSYQLTDQSWVDAAIETFTVYAADNSSHTITITLLAKESTGLVKGSIGPNDSVPEINCTTTVDSISALESAASYSMAPGTTLCLASGTYSRLDLAFGGTGTAKQPITIAAEIPGEVIISGEVSIAMSGEYVVLQGFIFKDGTVDNTIIQTRGGDGVPCNHCRITENSLINMDEGVSDTSKWVYIYGSDNRIDHNWFSGKTTRGALLVIDRYLPDGVTLDETFEIDRATIDHNYFGDRPPYEGKAYPSSSDNEFEVIRIGTSDSHMGDSYSVVEYNYFEKIQGEAEIISNKSGHNTIRYNTIRDSYGSIVSRHGEYATIANNFIFGDDYPFSGGIRLVDGNHVVVNNYIEGIRYKDSNWNGGIVLTSGNNSTTNGYQNVENVFIAHNTIIDSVNSLNVFGGKESTKPDSVYFVNNIIADAIGPVIINAASLPTNSLFANNIVYGEKLSDNDNLTSLEGMTFDDPILVKDTTGLFRPSPQSPDLSVDNTTIDVGDFIFPEQDMDGQTRSTITYIGADEPLTSDINIGPLSPELVGPLNYTPPATNSHVVSLQITNADFDSGDLTGWENNGGIITTDKNNVFSRGKSVSFSDTSQFIAQNIEVTPNTNYTFSAFVKGEGLLSVVVGDQTYTATQSKDDYEFTTLSFNSGDAEEVTLKASMNPNVSNAALLLNPKFDNKNYDHWDLYEGSGIGQIQDSSNSSDSVDGSVKFKYDATKGDNGTPYNPYIAQSVSVKPNTEYTLTMYTLLKSSHTGSTVLFGAFASDDTSLLSTNNATILASKNSVYSELVASGAEEAEDSFRKDTLTFNTGDNTLITIFAQYQSTTGDEIRVDDFNLSYTGAPSEGTKAYFDSFRLVSHAQ
jgi:poly(beta-D-mannuronate) lyase